MRTRHHWLITLAFLCQRAQPQQVPCPPSVYTGGLQRRLLLATSSDGSHRLVPEGQSAGRYRSGGISDSRERAGRPAGAANWLGELMGVG